MNERDRPVEYAHAHDDDDDDDGKSLAWIMLSRP